MWYCFVNRFLTENLTITIPEEAVPKENNITDLQQKKQSRKKTISQICNRNSSPDKRCYDKRSSPIRKSYDDRRKNDRRSYGYTYEKSAIRNISTVVRQLQKLLTFPCEEWGPLVGCDPMMLQFSDEELENITEIYRKITILKRTYNEKLRCKVNGAQCDHFQ